MWLRIDPRELTESERASILAQCGNLVLNSQHIIELEPGQIWIRRSIPLKNVRSAQLLAKPHCWAQFAQVGIGTALFTLAIIAMLLVVSRNPFMGDFNYYVPPIVGLGLFGGIALLTTALTIDAITAHRHFVVRLRTSNTFINIYLPKREVSEEAVRRFLQRMRQQCGCI